MSGNPHHQNCLITHNMPTQFTVASVVDLSLFCASFGIQQSNSASGDLKHVCQLGKPSLLHYIFT